MRTPRYPHLEALSRDYAEAQGKLRCPGCKCLDTLVEEVALTNVNRLGRLRCTRPNCQARWTISNERFGGPVKWAPYGPGRCTRDLPGVYGSFAFCSLPKGHAGPLHMGIDLRGLRRAWTEEDVKRDREDEGPAWKEWACAKCGGICYAAQRPEDGHECLDCGPTKWRVHRPTKEERERERGIAVELTRGEGEALLHLLDFIRNDGPAFRATDAATSLAAKVRASLRG